MITFVNRYGALTSAAYSISSIIWSYLQMPTMAIGASVSSMAAQNVGAGRWDRVGKVARSGVISGLIVTGSVAVLLYAFNDQVPEHSAARPGRRPCPLAQPHQPDGALGLRPLLDHLRPVRGGALHRRGLGAAGDPDHLDAA